jgi:hypothetical protein
MTYPSGEKDPIVYQAGIPILPLVEIQPASEGKSDKTEKAARTTTGNWERTPSLIRADRHLALASGSHGWACRLNTPFALPVSESQE